MLEGVVQIVCPHCDRDNRLSRDWLRNAPPCVVCGNALFEGRPVPLDDECRFDKHVRHNDIRFWHCSTLSGPSSSVYSTPSST